MSSTTPNLGLTIATSTSDLFDWEIFLKDNLNLIDAQFNAVGVSTVPIRFIESLTSLPVTSLSQGRLVYLTASVSGFSSNTIVEYNGTSWRVVGPREVQATIPATNNYTGRSVTLNAANGAFQAWDTLVNTDGINTWQRIDTDPLLTVGAFQSLSSFPDGFKALVQIDSTFGVNWLFRNNANSGSSYKFEATGGMAALNVEIDTNQTTNTTGAWVDLGTLGPSITVPLTGEYEIRAQATITGLTSSDASIGVYNGAGTVLTPQAQMSFGTGSGTKVSTVSLVVPRTALTRNNVIRLQYQTDTSGAGFSNRVLQLRPLRVNQS